MYIPVGHKKIQTKEFSAELIPVEKELEMAGT